MAISNIVGVCCRTLLLIILLIGFKSAFAIPCGKPSINVNDPEAVYLWRDCENLAWKFRAKAADGVFKVTGKILTDGAFLNVFGINLNPANDQLIHEENVIDFKLSVWDKNTNGFNFKTQNNDRVYLDLTGMGRRHVFLGPEKTQAQRIPLKLGGQGEQYNIIFILTDDQRFDTLWAMPNVKAELVDQGVNFTQAVVTSPLCCPARASILSGGLYDKNTGVYHNFLPNGSFELFNDEHNLGTALQQAGYHTGLIGKVMNGYPVGYVMPGWDYHNTNPGPSRENWNSFTATIGSSQNLPASGVVARSINRYITDYQKDKALEFIDSAPNKPFFLLVSTYAPHTPATADSSDLTPFLGYTYNGRGVLETDLTDKPKWVWNPTSDLSHKVPAPEFITQQLASLQAVDRMVASIVEKLEQTNEIDNTIIIFSSDNGYMWGEHGLWKKTHIFEESIRVPLAVRFPGITAREDTRQVATDTDIPGFILDVANSNFRTDGQSVMPLLLSENGSWREWLPISLYSKNFQSFAAIRSNKWKYTESVSDDIMLFDLENDPYELENLAGVSAYREIESKLKARLDSNKGLTISSVRLPEAVKGTFYSTQLSAWGGKPPYRWSVIDRAVKISLGKNKWSLNDEHLPLNLKGNLRLCGAPDIKMDEINRFYIWKECNNNDWHIRATSNSYRNSYSGQLLSNKPIIEVAPYKLQNSDEFEFLNQDTISFLMKVRNQNVNGFDFSLGGQNNFKLDVSAAELFSIHYGNAAFDITNNDGQKSLGNRLAVASQLMILQKTKACLYGKIVKTEYGIWWSAQVDNTKIFVARFMRQTVGWNY